MKGNHLHDFNKYEIIEKMAVERFKNVVTNNPTQPLNEVHASAYENLRQELNQGYSSTLLASALPDFERAKHCMKRARRKVIPVNPKNAMAIRLPEKYLNTGNDVRIRFLQIDITIGDSRLLAFATDRFLELLFNAHTILGDGTFFTVPKQFKQLYIIHCVSNNKVFPAVYALLPNQKAVTYLKLYEELKTIAGTRFSKSFEPHVAQLDFEISAINALKTAFPSIRIKACHFHFTQALWKHMDKKHLRGEYQKTSEVHQMFNRAKVLPFLKNREDLDACVNTLIVSAPYENLHVRNWIKYLRDTWTNIDARFTQDLWNQNGMEGPRTTNHLESFHRYLKSKLRKSPNLWNFLDRVQYEESKFWNMVSQSTFRQIRDRIPVTEREREASLQILLDRYNCNQVSAIQFMDSAVDLLNPNVILETGNSEQDDELTTEAEDGNQSMDVFPPVCEPDMSHNDEEVDPDYSLIFSANHQNSESQVDESDQEVSENVNFNTFDRIVQDGGLTYKIL